MFINATKFGQFLFKTFVLERKLPDIFCYGFSLRTLKVYSNIYGSKLQKISKHIVFFFKLFHCSSSIQLLLLIVSTCMIWHISANAAYLFATSLYTASTRSLALHFYSKSCHRRRWARLWLGSAWIDIFLKSLNFILQPVQFIARVIRFVTSIVFPPFPMDWHT